MINMDTPQFIMFESDNKSEATPTSNPLFRANTNTIKYIFPISVLVFIEGNSESGEKILTAQHASCNMGILATFHNLTLYQLYFILNNSIDYVLDLDKAIQLHLKGKFKTKHPRKRIVSLTSKKEYVQRFYPKILELVEQGLSPAKAALKFKISSSALNHGLTPSQKAELKALKIIRKTDLDDYFPANLNVDEDY